MSDKLIGMYELLDAIEAAIGSADPATREHLAQTIDAYADDFPDEFFWATGPQAPVLLHHLTAAIDMSCRPEGQQKAR
jgi:hypothetical protein